MMSNKKDVEFEAIRETLEKASTCVMIADANRNIVYLNKSVASYLREAESDIKKDLPHLTVDKRIGINIDVFHKNVEHQRDMLSKLTSPYRTEIKVGGRHFDLVATPIFGKKSNRLGTFVEWADASVRLKAISYERVFDAFKKTYGMIEYGMDGTVLTANQQFLDIFGYDLSDIQGRHHSMLVDQDYVKTPAYKEWWAALNRGEPQRVSAKRVLGKNGKIAWVAATYNPILDEKGKPFKMVQIATDVTETMLQNAEYKGQIDAILKSQSVIHFGLDEKVIWANDIFCNLFGYRLEEIQGQSAGIFMDDAARRSPDHHRVWDELRAGHSKTGEFKRMGKGDKEIYIQASYNAILDPTGKVFKIIEFATDVTKAVHQRMEGARIGGLVDQNLEKIVQAVASVNQQSAMAASASEETSTTVQTVASASEELNSSVREISQSMNLSKAAVEDVMKQTAMADQSTQKLTKNAEAMSGIVELIQKIASQINLLALNATIESARAGDAGKGFAVVASEVKNLARQVEQATGNISSEIQSIQTVSGEVVSALNAIKQSVGAVQNSVTGVASAIEEQSAVT